MKTVIFTVRGMHCASCAMNIDGELEDTEGVEESDTHYAKGKTEVTFDEKVISADALTRIIANVGYEAVEEK